MEGILKSDQKSVIEKTEELLKKYEQFKLSDQPATQKMLAKVDDALKSIQSDPYYRIIPMFFFDHVSREDIAFHFGVTERTITRHKSRLIENLSVILFSDDVLMDIFC
jgi:DNA-directed RNA polymerase specialized sigma subunit